MILVNVGQNSENGKVDNEHMLVRNVKIKSDRRAGMVDYITMPPS
jgi:hypothetical protein